ncbi:spore cortex biosynthesis protein YabQ [Paenibacillus durus]|uniref:Spore cortex biosynthesis protein YabQ n=1 Tax=Paenibacillus durus ATCC 35681 TaxID=1333534 RepID=A0A0F7FEC4_PAEDU|nr:spore cortex biosynthesis protein YabQ [Paenibacillus durus]AKG36934.1 spore cortex biosynthesis protein YabQ [Paenibacillus durus ATCC 35681]
MNPAVQWITLLYMIVAGAAMGLTFDGYRVLSLKLRFPGWLNAVLDLLYWLASALIVFRLLYAGNQGQLRFYAFLGLFVGVWAYFLIFSVTVQKFVVMLIQTVEWIWKLLMKLLGILIGMPLLWLWKLALGILRLLGRILGFVLKLLLRLTKPLWIFPVRWLSPAYHRLLRSAPFTKLANFIAARRKR